MRTLQEEEEEDLKQFADAYAIIAIHKWKQVNPKKLRIWKFNFYLNWMYKSTSKNIKIKIRQHSLIWHNSSFAELVLYKKITNKIKKKYDAVTKDLMKWIQKFQPI